MAVFAKPCPTNELAEDILLCIDLSPEMNEPWGESTSSSRFEMVREALCCFAKHKLSWDKRNRIGICVFADIASVLLEFTSEIDLVAAMIKSINPTSASQVFSFDNLFGSFGEV
jgi:Mg-chelatase subunit ChlD